MFVTSFSVQAPPPGTHQHEGASGEEEQQGVLLVGQWVGPVNHEGGDSHGEGDEAGAPAAFPSQQDCERCDELADDREDERWHFADAQPIVKRHAFLARQPVDEPVELRPAVRDHEASRPDAQEEQGQILLLRFHGNESTPELGFLSDLQLRTSFASYRNELCFVVAFEAQILHFGLKISYICTLILDGSR